VKEMMRIYWSLMMFNTLWTEKHSPEKYQELLNHPGVHLIPEESEKEEEED